MKLTKTQRRMLADACGAGTLVLFSAAQIRQASRLAEEGYGEIKGDTFTGKYFMVSNLGRTALSAKEAENG